MISCFIEQLESLKPIYLWVLSRDTLFIAVFGGSSNMHSSILEEILGLPILLETPGFEIDQGII